MNAVTICGHLGRHPEGHDLPNGGKVVHLSVATSRKWRNKAGEIVEETEWHRVAVFGQSADACMRYLVKGQRVLVTGRLRTRKWTDDAGVDRWTTDIIADRVMFLDAPRGHRPPEPPAESDEPDDEIPF